jgi:hypothetical protein
MLPCYNEAMYVKLADGGTYVWTKETRAFGNGHPERTGEVIMGFTDAYYYCIKSVSPVLEVWPAKHIGAMARRG